jgi:hypothetical protein
MAVTDPAGYKQKKPPAPIIPSLATPFDIPL